MPNGPRFSAPPTVNPCPGSGQFTAPAPNSTVLLSSLTNLMVAARNFTPGRTVNITYKSPGGTEVKASATVAPNGTFSRTMNVPGGVGTAYLLAEDGCRSASEQFSEVL